MPAAQAVAERQRTKEAQRIIGMVEPGMPQGLGGARPASGSGAQPGGSTTPKSKETCIMQ
jgi:hypothetical protein